MKKKTFYFVLEFSQLTRKVVIVSGEQWRDLAIHIRVSILPQTPSHPGCIWHWAELPLLYSRSLWVIHFKYSSVYISIPNSLTIPSPHPFPQKHKFILREFEKKVILEQITASWAFLKIKPAMSFFRSSIEAGLSAHVILCGPRGTPELTMAYAQIHVWP